MISLFSAGCLFFTDKPSDSQIKKDIEEYFASRYKPLQINKIYIKGIFFIKEGDILSKVAVAIVRIEAEVKADYNIPSNMSPSKFTFLSVLPIGLDKNHKKGDIIRFGINQKYLRSDRAWLPSKITSNNISIIDESGE